MNSGLQLEQLIDIALVKRQLRGTALVYDRTQLRGGSINDRWRAGDLDRLGGRADLQRDVQAEGFVQVDGNAFAHVFLETLLGDVNFVRANGHLNEKVFAVAARVGVTRHVGGFVDQRHLGRSHRATALIGNRAARALRARKWRGEKHREYWNRNEKKRRTTE